MRTENFLTARIVSSLSQFSYKLEQPNFYDVIPLGKESCIFLEDGSVIVDRNVISISSKIYSTSKLLLWRTYFYVCGALSLYANLCTRLILTGKQI